MQCKKGDKPKRVKKPTKTQLNKKADTEWSALVKVLAGGRCEVCGTTQNLNSHHVFGRSNYKVRWDVHNGVCLCVGHHKFNREFSAHNTPTLFSEFIRLKRGEEWHQQLTVKARYINNVFQQGDDK